MVMLHVVPLFTYCSAGCLFSQTFHRENEAYVWNRIK